MKILVVHDRNDVALDVADVIKSTLGETTGVDVAEDGVSARRLLASSVYDLVVVDLTIPHIKGRSAPTHIVVEQLLQELFTLDTFNVPGDVIGMSRDPDAQFLINTSLGTHLMVTITEDSSGGWRSQLADKLRYAARASKTRTVVSSQYYTTDALIVTALDKEMAPYLSKFEFSDVKDFPGAKEFIFTDNSGSIRKGVAFAIGRAGQASAASHTQSLLSYFRPRYAVMSGYCGGVKGKVKLGDLVFFENVFDWDYGKWEASDAMQPSTDSIFHSRPSPLSIEDNPSHRVLRDFVMSDFCQQPKLMRRLKELSKSDFGHPEMHLYPAASGSAVVADDLITTRIRGLNEAIRGVDMESYGFYFSCKRTRVVKPDFFCVKAVSDFCNGDKNDDFHPLCSELSSAAVFELLTKHLKY